MDASHEWSANAINLFKKLVLNKSCTLNIKRKLDQNAYEIDLFLKTTNVGEQLIKDRCAIPDDNAELAIIQEKLNNMIPVDEVSRFSNRFLN